MKIRSKLTLQFTIIVVSTFIIFSLVIYLFSAQYRFYQFKSRLEDKALTMIKLVIEFENIDSVLFNFIESVDQTILFREKTLIFNKNNEIIFDSKDEISLQFSDEILQEVRKNKEYAGKNEGYEFLGILYNHNNIEYIVISSAYDKFGINKLKNLRNILIISFFILLIVTFLLGRFFSKKALNPISEMILQVKELKQSHLKARLNTGSNNDELAELASTFNLLLNELETAFIAQKEFVSNASHELRNPLSVIKSQIDVILLNHRTEEEYIEVLKSISDDIISLSDTTNSLLLLAQTTSSTAYFTFIVTNLDDILWDARQLVLKKNKNYNIKIEFNNQLTDESDFRIKANNILLRNAFINIIENACRYSENKTVKISIGRKDKYIEILFSDNGIGISDDDIKSIFKPFYRGQNVKHIEGHGIGLSLVYNIIYIHKGQLNIESEINKGTTVILSLPTNI